ncbi:sulfotransferase [Cognatishimia sp. SS12]|uniref:sulfotransferase n=1 Tax=Cognatishimia sp. SS12 TaxID=2979465 RepID=UPI00232AE4C8|nr:sulfotransferase [Cognatishimia sp. SS12]MDC0739683.1 sulfotransferase [Cognatishimia sp. SS12]
MRKNDTRLVFCCGCDRSGTTILSRELGNLIPNSIVLPEAHFFAELRKVPLGALQNNLVQALSTNQRYQIWGKGELRFNFTFETYEELFIRLAFLNFDVPVETEVLIDSTPIAYLWKVNGEFKNSTFIHIKRDARSTVRSLLNVSWGPTHTGKAVEYWIDRVHLARQLTEFEVNFEDFISQSRAQINSLLLYLENTGFCPNMGDFNQSIDIKTLPEFTRKQHKLLGKALDLKKAKIESNWFIDYYYKNNFSAQILNHDENDYPEIHYRWVKIVEFALSIFRQLKDTVK